ncbi:glycosyltransferase family 2 protein [Virgibacillus dakarensis]|nr:glycosyltransferase family 2 protein [Virgibacillus dakarensis]
MEFTVIIPLYNKAAHIKRAINSVLNQTHKELELIVVDDGSTDSSVQEVNKVIDSRIRLIRQKNSGVSVARNKGISEANYEYIAFLDADDIWKSNFLETIVGLIEEYPSAGAYATCYEIKERDKILSLETSFGLEKGWKGIVDDYFRLSNNYPLISSSSVVIQKNTFNHLGTFPVGIARGEDLDMWLRIALDYDIAFFNKVCATYFRDTENMATKRMFKLSESITGYAEDILKEVKESGKSTIYIEKYLVKLIIKKARYLITFDRSKEARRLLNKYRHISYNKKEWLKCYLLSYKPVYIVYKRLK